jgi:hypothetical protein
MDYLTLLQGVGVGVAASIALVLLLARTIASLIIYRVIGEWKIADFINGLFKQAILYGVVLVALILTYLVVHFGVKGEVLMTIKAMYYALIALVVTFTVGKLTILLQYAFGEQADLSDFK